MKNQQNQKKNRKKNLRFLQSQKLLKHSIKNFLELLLQVKKLIYLNSINLKRKKKILRKTVIKLVELTQQEIKINASVLKSLHKVVVRKTNKAPEQENQTKVVDKTALGKEEIAIMPMLITATQEINSETEDNNLLLRWSQRKKK